MKLSRIRSAFVLIACSAGFLHADVVTLKDGRKLEGNILSESADAIRMRYKLTPKIWDEKDIQRSEIAEGGILKQKPEEVELIELKKLVPTVDLLTAEKYEQIIQDRLRPFINRYPKTPEAAEAEKMLAVMQEEKEKVVAGGIKLEGKWLNPDETKAESLNIKAYGLRAAMMEKAEAKDYSGALKEFDKLSDPRSGYIASIYYPKAVEEAVALLTKYEAQVEQMIKDQPTLLKMREDGIKKLIEPDLTRMKDAVKREEELWKTNYDQERKSSRWYTPYKYDMPSLKTLSQSIITEKNRLKDIDIPVITKVNEAIARLMRADAKAAQNADELKKMGEAILEGETAAASADSNSMQFYQNVFQAYRQRYAYAEQQLAVATAQQQMPAPAAGGVATGSSAIAGTGAAPGEDAKMAAALAAAAAGNTAAPNPNAAAPGMPAQGTTDPNAAQVPGAVPNGYPAQPGAMPAPGTVPNGYPQQQPGYAQQQQPGYAPQQQGYAQPQQPVASAPMPVTPPEEEGMSTTNMLLIGIGVVVLVLLLTLLGGGKKKQK